jgi:hypothetical protein
VLLLWRAGANEATDAYYYLFSVGMLPIQIVLVGVMYPLLLNSERLTRRALVRLRWFTPLLSIVLMVGGATWMMMGGRLPVELFPIAILSIVNGYFQSRLWYRAVTAEASGNARWISGIALPANLLAALTLLFPWGTSVTAVVAMQIALVVGNTGLLLVSRHLEVGDAVVAKAPLTSTSTSESRSTGTYWFLTKSSIAYLGLTVLQSLAIMLPASSLTLLNVAAKIVGSVSATLVNAIMPLVIHQDTESRVGAERFLRALLWLLGIGGALFVSVVGFSYPVLTAAALCVSLWVIGSSASAVSQRMAFRFLAPNASRVTIVVVPIVVAIALLSSMAPHFQLLTLICAYASLDGLTGAVLLRSLGNNWLSLVMSVLCAAIAAVWFMSAIGIFAP